MCSIIFTDSIINDFISNNRTTQRKRQIVQIKLLTIDNTPTHPPPEMLSKIDSKFRVIFLLWNIKAPKPYTMVRKKG